MLSLTIFCLLICIAPLCHANASDQDWQMTVVTKRTWWLHKYKTLRVEKTNGSWSYDLKKGDQYARVSRAEESFGYNGDVRGVIVDEGTDTWSLMTSNWFPERGGDVYEYQSVRIKGEGGLEELFNGCAVEFQRFNHWTSSYKYLNCNANTYSELSGDAGKAYWDSKNNDAAFSMGGDVGMPTIVRQITWPEFIVILVAVCLLCCGCIGCCVHRRRKKRNLAIGVEEADRYESLIDDHYTDDLVQQDLKV
mmetsp:Transcript_29880/g.48671  ORF Transcript_29880/g.48671 Transcript_29880/m.48671 type:complete len:250 (-) Transcript_29880:154-903(-)